MSLSSRVSDLTTRVAQEFNTLRSEVPGSFVHTQTVAASEWGPIVHGLGYRPNVTVVDTNGIQMFPTVDHVNATTVLITHSTPYAGAAYFS